MRNPAVLLLAAANFSIVCGHYGVESFLPTILQQLVRPASCGSITWLVMLPFVAMLLGQMLVSWQLGPHRRALVAHRPAHVRRAPLALLLTPLSRGHLALTLLCFAVALAGIRSYLAPFYALPRLFLQRHGRGRRHRPHQRHRQPGRLRRVRA